MEIRNWKQGDLVRLRVNPGWSDEWSQGTIYKLLAAPQILPNRGPDLRVIVMNSENELDDWHAADFDYVPQ